MEQRQAHIAIADPAERAALVSALAEHGWTCTVHDDPCSMPTDERAAVLVDLALAAPDDALALVARLAAGAAAAVLVRIAPGATVAQVLAAGATDVLEPGADPALVAHRLERCPAAAAASEQNDSFHARLGERLVRARERETQVPVIVVRVPGRGARLAEDIRAAVVQAVDQIERTSELALTAARAVTLEVGEDGQALLIPELTRVQDAARFATALRASLATQIDTPLHLGIAVSPTDGTDPDALLSHAYDASQRALKDGQGEIVFHSAAMGRWAFERLTLETSLRKALDNGELVAYYQPRVDIESRQIRGMEALIRWIHPEFGLVSPAQFIPLAEETGLIGPIGEWMVGQAAAQNKQWREEGLPPIRISVNLSPVQFRKPDLFEAIRDEIENTGLTPDALELEVTESLLMNDPHQTAAVLRRFKEYGLHLSIDDFGTGYSSLSYLKRFPIDALKVDRSFVSDVTTNADDAAITTAIILMGHSLKLKVVAEGVETESQLAFLKLLQCNEAQGYLFSPPVPADKAAALIAAGGFARPMAA